MSVPTPHPTVPLAEVAQPQWRQDGGEVRNVPPSLGTAGSVVTNYLQFSEKANGGTGSRVEDVGLKLRASDLGSDRDPRPHGPPPPPREPCPWLIVSTEAQLCDPGAGWGPARPVFPHVTASSPLCPTGARFPGVGVLPGVPTGTGVKAKAPGTRPAGWEPRAGISTLLQAPVALGGGGDGDSGLRALRVCASGAPARVQLAKMSSTPLKNPQCKPGGPGRWGHAPVGLPPTAAIYGARGGGAELMAPILAGGGGAFAGIPGEAEWGVPPNIPPTSGGWAGQ